MPSCNILGELVIIEKLKPANCVCTKNQIAFCDVDYLSKLVASLYRSVCMRVNLVKSRARAHLFDL